MREYSFDGLCYCAYNHNSHRLPSRDYRYLSRLMIARIQSARHNTSWRVKSVLSGEAGGERGTASQLRSDRQSNPPTNQSQS